MNTRCPLKRVPSATRFFTLSRLTVQPPQSYSVGGQRSSGQLTGKPAGTRPDYRGHWCTRVAVNNFTSKLNLVMRLLQMLKKECSSKSKLFQFWEAHITMVHILLDLIQAERDGNWSLHLNAAAAMLPYVFAFDRQKYSNPYPNPNPYPALMI
ncbi:UNVERIFIED_CONTAM: hypothetical protein FKN15_053830 [Acipenser sinensis]